MSPSRTLAALLLATALGCSGRVPLTEETRRSVRTVSIVAPVPAAGTLSGNLPGVSVESPGAVWYSSYLTAPVGVVCDLFHLSETGERRADAFAYRMEESGVDVGRIVHTGFRKKLLATELFRVSDASDVDARFQLDVRYGLDDGWGVRGSWKVSLDVEGSLVDRQGEVLWRSSASISSADERVPELLDPFRRPDLLARAYARAANLVTRALLRDLCQRRG